MDPVGLYAECSTLGTIVILFVYVLTMASLPVFAWRRHRDRFSVVRHVVLPLLGTAALAVPFVTLCTPASRRLDAFPLWPWASWSRPSWRVGWWWPGVVGRPGRP